MANRVARYQADRTNQKMYFCRIYCQLAEQSEGQIRDAHIESALMHLYGGYLAFLQEIARYYNLKIPNPNLQSISEALETKTQISPEVMRLSQLLQNDFLGDIEKAWQQILYKPVPQNLDNNSEESNKLPVIDIMANPSNTSITVDMIRQWRSELVDIIDSLREGMIEF